MNYIHIFLNLASWSCLPEEEKSNCGKIVNILTYLFVVEDSILKKSIVVDDKSTKIF
jgi:hypothetical protein